MIKLAEREFFFNHFPNLARYLHKAGREQEARMHVRSLLTSIFKRNIENKIDRYIEIPEIGFIPADTEYFKLYSELFDLYTNGFYYSTIVLTGVLCERICYDILSNQKIRIGENEYLSPEQIECLFEMNLFYLISLLNKWELIKDETKDEMIEVNNQRNRYVHPKKKGNTLRQEALGMLKKITKVLKNEFEMEAIPIR